MKLVAPAGSNAKARRIQDVVRQASANSARSLQTSLGPSQIGNPCDRQLTFALLDMAPANSGGTSDPWPAIVGTAVHAWLADAFRAENDQLPSPRYLVETRVKLTDGIGGTCDLFDLDEAEVIDHKVLGVDSARKIRSGAIPAHYRTQLHLYGYGFRLAGRAVSTVTLAVYPRSGWIDDLYLWSEPYNEPLAVAAMDRLANLTTAAYALKLDERLDLWARWTKSSPDAECQWCPWWRPGAAVDGHGCPGPELPA